MWNQTGEADVQAWGDYRTDDGYKRVNDKIDQQKS